MARAKQRAAWCHAKGVVKGERVLVTAGQPWRGARDLAPVAGTGNGGMCWRPVARERANVTGSYRAIMIAGEPTKKGAREDSPFWSMRLADQHDSGLRSV